METLPGVSEPKHLKVFDMLIHLTSAKEEAFLVSH